MVKDSNGNELPRGRLRTGYKKSEGQRNFNDSKAGNALQKYSANLQR